MRRAHPDALRADIQQTYGLDSDGVEPLRLASLTSQLPPTSRVMRALAGVDECWGAAEWMLWSIELHLRALATNQEVKPLPCPLDQLHQRPVNADALADALGIPDEMR